MNEIVVGVDASEAAQRALRWALDEAEHRSVPVRVVHVYSTASLYVTDLTGYAQIDKLVSEICAEAERLVTDLVADALEGHPAWTVTPVTVDATSPAQVLRARAADAAMLVVGTRGHGGFVGLLLGSVSHQCVSHPPCPVVVVPPDA